LANEGRAGPLPAWNMCMAMRLNILQSPPGIVPIHLQDVILFCLPCVVYPVISYSRWQGHRWRAKLSDDSQRQWVHFKCL